MPHTRPPPTIALVALAMLLPTAPAHHWDCSEADADGEYAYLPPGARDGGSAPVYVVIPSEPYDGRFLYWPWIYAESNGEPGLQRSDACRDPKSDGSHYTREDADTIIF